MALSQTTVLKVYNAVIDDVIGGVRDCFLDDGVDEQVLQELKQLWESKLMASKAIEINPDPIDHPPLIMNNQKANGNKSGNSKKNALHQNNSEQHNISQANTNASHTNITSNQNTGLSNAASNQPNPTVMSLDPNNKVPIQLTLPAQAGVPGSQPKVFTIQIPASALQGNQLHRILSGPFIASTLQLPQPLAATLLQQHITAALLGNNNTSDGGGGGGTALNKSMGPYQVDGACDLDADQPSCSISRLSHQSTHTEDTTSFRKRPNFIVSHSRRKTLCLSLDGALDSSDDEQADELVDGSDVGDDDDDDDDDDDEDVDGGGIGGSGDDEEGGDGGAEDEPLNSGDDVSEEDPVELFDTDNVVVCQYDKITRSRNKWKFYLKDGIMNLSGKDFVFQKANGDAEW